MLNLITVTFDKNIEFNEVSGGTENIFSKLPCHGVYTIFDVFYSRFTSLSKRNYFLSNDEKREFLEEDNIEFVNYDLPKQFDYTSFREKISSEEGDFVFIFNSTFPLEEDLAHLLGFHQKNENAASFLIYDDKKLGIIMNKGDFSNQIEKIKSSEFTFRTLELLVENHIQNYNEIKVNPFISDLKNGKDFYKFNILPLFEKTTFDLLQTVTKRMTNCKETILLNGSKIVNSFLSHGNQVSGAVKNSVLFEDVFIGKNTKVINSVIMPHVKIGNDCKVSNSIVGSIRSNKNIKIPDGMNIGDASIDIHSSEEIDELFLKKIMFLNEQK